MATAPATQTTTRTREREEGGTGTPERAQPVRRTITHELPSGFDLGTVNAAATQRTVSQVMGIDRPAGCFAPETAVKFKKEYEGGRTSLGSVVIQLTKDEHDAIVCMLFKTEPWQIGKSAIASTNKAAKGKGKEPEMKVRHKGIGWVGADKSALTSHCPYLEKMGWFATAGSCKGAKKFVSLIKSLSSELLTANLAANFYLGEIAVPAAKPKGQGPQRHPQHPAAQDGDRRRRQAGQRRRERRRIGGIRGIRVGVAPLLATPPAWLGMAAGGKPPSSRMPDFDPNQARRKRTK